MDSFCDKRFSCHDRTIKISSEKSYMKTYKRLNYPDFAICAKRFFCFAEQLKARMKFIYKNL